MGFSEDGLLGAGPGEKELFSCQNKKPTNSLGQSKALSSDDRQQRHQSSLQWVTGVGWGGMGGGGKGY